VEDDSLDRDGEMVDLTAVSLRDLPALGDSALDNALLRVIREAEDSIEAVHGFSSAIS
jgi:FXSXX-COOH protein